MDLHFLGGATTVTGSQFLLEIDGARILVDCGMFQGGPNESVRNRIPFAYDPATVDAVLLTHAHLDHCGLLPHLVARGFSGPIYATHGTIELATLVLLDSGRLQKEFAKREAKWERRHPDEVEEDDRGEREKYDAALALAESGAALTDSPAIEPPGTIVTGEHVATTIEAAGTGETVDDPEAALRAQPPELIVDLDEAVYTEREARATLPLFRPIDYEEEREIVPGITVTFVDAGHILGSAIVKLRVAAAGDRPERTIVFSGDLGRPNTPIIRDPTVLTEADYVVVESTYGGREHDPQDEAVRILAETVRLVAESEGVLLVPSFAIGRTQEVVWQLDRLIDEGKIPLLPLYLDSPMASKASDIYRRHPDYFDAETRGLLDRGGSPLDYPDQTVTNSVHESKAISRAPRPYMVVASNGMLTGGRVVGHLRELIGDPTAVILFVGYQGEGTLGAHLQAGAREVRIDGQMRQVRCQTRSISGFSAHADESELLDWIGNFIRDRKAGEPGVPRRVFIVHGDPEAQEAIEPRIKALGLETLVPRWRQRVTLD
jgi:metallo-beta-lactamase family protein